LSIFRATPHALIPPCALGVFISCTLSQSSMVRHWLRRRTEGWWWRASVNGVGAFVTGLVMLTIAVTKFSHGAWSLLLLIPSLVALFIGMRRHYDDVALQLSLEDFT